MKKKFGIRVSGLLAAMLIAMGAASVTAGAAQDFDPEYFDQITLNKFVHTEYTMGLGEYEYTNHGAANYVFEDRTYDYELPFGFEKGATYRAVSSNSKIVDCYIEGTGVQLVGKSAGKAIVTLQKKYGSGWVSLDSVSITVFSSYLTAEDNYEHKYALGAQPSGLVIKWYNPDATYSYNVNKPGLEVREVRDENGSLIYLECTATKLGDYTLTITETFNGVSKKFQKVSMHVLPTSVKKAVTVSLSDPNITTLKKYISNPRNDMKYIFKMSDGTKNNIEYVPDYVSDVDQYINKYGNPHRCVAVTYNGSLSGFTQAGKCKVDIYEAKMSVEEMVVHDFDTLPANAVYVGSCEITVVS